MVAYRSRMRSIFLRPDQNEATMDNESIKTNILRFRQKAGLTIEQVAVALDITVQSYRKVEKGSTKIIYRHLDKMAALFGVTPEEILLGYQPLDPSSAQLLEENDKVQYIHDLAEDYEKRIRELKASLEEKERVIADLRDSIASKNALLAISGGNLSPSN